MDCFCMDTHWHTGTFRHTVALLQAAAAPPIDLPAGRRTFQSAGLVAEGTAGPAGDMEGMLA